MPFIRNQLNRKIREFVLSDIQRRGTLISPEEVERIRAIMSSTSHSVPLFVPESLAEITNSDQINRAFDLMWLDHSILIEDVMVLYRLYQSIMEKTKERLVMPRISIKKAISTTRNYLKVKGYENFYNLVYSFHMGSAINEEKINRKLAIDKESGVAFLPVAKEQRYSTNADMNVTFDLLTKGCKIIEQSETEYLFDSDLTWYMNVVAEKLLNPHPYEDYDGVILSINIELPSVVNINNIKIRLLSDVTQEIVGVFYAKNYSDPQARNPIENYSVINSGFITDISFEPVYTRRLSILVGSKLFREIEKDQILDRVIDKDYVSKVTREVREIEAESLFLDLPPAESVSRERITDAMFMDPIELRKGRKIYSIPVRTVEVLYREYEAYGSFSSKGIVLEGNLALVTMEEEVVNADGIKVAKKVIINGIEYSIGSLEEDGYVRDVVVIKQGSTDNREKMYYFTTNFIPRFDNELEITAFGSALDLSNINFAITEQLQTGNRYYMSASSDLVDGTTMVVRYLPALYDRAGIEYDPRKLDVIVSIGKPNVKNNLIANRISRDIYFYPTPTTISRYATDTVSISKGKYRLPVSNSGTTLYGEPLSIGTIFWNGSNGYLELDRKVYGPYRGVYLLMEEEKNVDDQGFLEEIGNPSIKGTSEPYVRGMIQIFQRNRPVVITEEYEANYGPIDDYKRVRVALNSVDRTKPVKVYYHPIPRLDGTYSSKERNNIEKYNANQNIVTSTEIMEVTLDRYPFVDPDIVNSSFFVKKSGTWFFKDRTSIIYEPVLIYVDRKKLEYDKDYKLSGRKISFTKPVRGNINIRYYVLADRVGFKVEMYREEPLKVGNTAKLSSFLALGKVVK